MLEKPILNGDKRSDHQDYDRRWMILQVQVVPKNSRLENLDYTVSIDVFQMFS